MDRIEDAAAKAYWSDVIVGEQRDVMISAGATAVGINMTFLMPYSLLSRGWDRAFRGLTIFDLSTGTFIPFILATGCVVIAAAAQFHAKLPDGTTITAESVQPPQHMQGAFDGLLAKRNAAAESGSYEMQGDPSIAEQQLAAVLVRRDTFDLAKSLSQLFGGEENGNGHFFANIVFGLGVVGMTLSTISLLMLISGLIVCEVFRHPPTGWVFRIGCLAAATGTLWPIVWTGGARAWLAIVTSVFGMMLLPIAYFTFFCMMNQRSLLGDQMPTGGKRVVWNVLMAIAVLSATAAAISAIMSKAGTIGLGIAGGFVALVLFAQVVHTKPTDSPAD